MKQILFIHDNILYRDAICRIISLLYNDFEITSVIDTNNVDDDYDLILMERNVDFIHKLSLKKSKIILFSDDFDDFILKDFPHIKGLIQKDCPSTVLQECINKVLSGNVFYQKNDSLKPSKPNRIISLTKREREVLEHLAQGESNKEIANILGLEVVTIKLHVRSICKKLNVSNRTKAALLFKESTWN